jgi:carbamoyl-phosphate synthase large subunit
VQGFAAAVQGIEALIRGDIGVRSLQEHAADLRQLRADGDAARELKNRGE